MSIVITFQRVEPCGEEAHEELLGERRAEIVAARREQPVAREPEDEAKHEHSRRRHALRAGRAKLANAAAQDRTTRIRRATEPIVHATSEPTTIRAISVLRLTPRDRATRPTWLLVVVFLGLLVAMAAKVADE